MVLFKHVVTGTNRLTTLSSLWIYGAFVYTHPVDFKRLTIGERVWIYAGFIDALGPSTTNRQIHDQVKILIKGRVGIAHLLFSRGGAEELGKPAFVRKPTACPLALITTSELRWVANR